jgi:hypothetical protein
MRRLAIALATGGITAILIAQPAAATPVADSANCWGVVTSQRAVAYQDIGEHASSFEEPRLGLGNVSRAVVGEDAHPGDLGALFAVTDGLDATNCP